MSETIDEVIRQSQTHSPHKRSPHPMMSPKVKSEPIPMSSPNIKSQTFDDDEAAQILVSMASDKVVPKRKKNKPSSTATCPSPSNESNSIFQSAMSSFPKVSPGTSPLSPTMFSISNQNPYFPTPPLFGHMSPPLLTPMQSSPTHGSYTTPPVLTKPKTLAEKKALPPEILNAPVIKKDKDKENKTDKKERERDRDRKERKSVKQQKTKKFKSRKTISEDDSSSEDEKKPKLNIKLGSTSKPVSTPSDKLSVKTISETKAPAKTLLSPKHNVPIQEDMSKKKRGPKKRPIKEEVKEDKSCIVIRETITVDTGEGDGKVWICPACKGPDDGSPMIGKSKSGDPILLKTTRSGLKY